MAFNLYQTDGANSSFEFIAYAPPEIESIAGPPIVVFLHGAGERGSHPATALQNGIDAVFEKLNLPAVVVFPPCAADHRAFYGAMEQRVLSSIDIVQKKFNADSRRIYLVGYSMGATSSMYLAARHREKFAGIVSVALGITWPGGAEWPQNFPDDEEARRLFAAMFVSDGRAQFIAEHVREVPIWFLHGELDDGCPVTDSLQVEMELRRWGANPKLTIYSQWGHDCLVHALMQEGLFDWLLSQYRPERAIIDSSAPQDTASVRTTT